MPKRPVSPRHAKFSAMLAIVMLALVLGYFKQSLVEIGKSNPMHLTIERLKLTLP